MIHEVPITDEDLMLRVARGDAQALEELYDRYVRQCFGLALKLLGDAGPAEEIVQEAFLKAWTQPWSYLAERGKFLGWLLSVVHNRCVDELRKRSSSDVRLEDLTAGNVLDTRPDPEPEPAEQLWVREQQRLVRQALDQIPASQRQVIELACFAGLSQSQIAARLGQPLGTVKSRVRQGLQSLRGLLDAHGFAWPTNTAG